MRQVASVVKDGHVRYFIADVEEGELTEFATIAVPESFDAERAIKLGFNLISAVGLNGHAHRPNRVGALTEPAPAAVLPAGDNRLRWNGTESLMAYVTSHPGKRPQEIADAFGTPRQRVQSAVNRARAQKLVRSDVSGRVWPLDQAGVVRSPSLRKSPSTRRRWEIKTEEIIDYVRAHPRSSLADIANALAPGEEGVSERLQRQAISNRFLSVRARFVRGAGPELVMETAPRPGGGGPDINLYSIRDREPT